MLDLDGSAIMHVCLYVICGAAQARQMQVRQRQEACEPADAGRWARAGTSSSPAYRQRPAHGAGKQDSATPPVSQLTLGDGQHKPLTQNLSLLPGAGKQDSAKPPVSQLTLGDGRVRAFQTSYAAEFAPPLPAGACLRSPLRNSGLAAATTDLRAVYRSAFQRTGECVSPGIQPMTFRV